MQPGIEVLNAAIAHHMAGRIVAAESLYRQVLDEDSAQPSALYLLGVLALSTGRVDHAVDLLERAAEQRPCHPEGRFALANARYRQGDRAGAAAGYRAVLALQPEHGGATINLARVLREGGEIAAALALLDAPSGPAGHSALAATLLAAGDDEAAVAAADRALALDPNAAEAWAAEAWFVRGTALGRRQLFPAAMCALRRAIEADPDHAAARLNLGNILVDLDRLAEAEGHIRAAIELDPNLVEAHASLGFLLAATGRTVDAVSACETATRLRPDFAQAHWNQAVAHLLAGDYAPGWEKYEWRKRHEMFGAAFRPMAGQSWEGDDIAGRTLLVLAEQGFGDTIQFSRYLPLLIARGAAVVLACAPALKPLLCCIAGLTLVDRDGPLPPYDLWVDQMSLPRLFTTRIDSVPLAGGYLCADRALVAAWAARLPAGRRVGLVWAGNPGHSNDRRRSMAFACLAPLLELPAIGFVSLQVGPAAEDLAGSGVLDVSASLVDYRQTAAVVANLDLVITVDTSVCHLAGALGVPTWVMLPYAPEWRWLTDRSDTPWYRSITLFRQSRPGDWEELAWRVRQRLAEDNPVAPAVNFGSAW